MPQLRNPDPIRVKNVTLYKAGEQWFFTGRLVDHHPYGYPPGELITSSEIHQFLPLQGLIITRNSLYQMV